MEITAQYLDYVRHMEREDLNVVSEFLVMAATLLDIKAKMLLPKELDEEGEFVRLDGFLRNLQGSGGAGDRGGQPAHQGVRLRG